MNEVDRKPYPEDVTDEECTFVLPYLLLSREDSRSRKHSLRELLNGVRYIVCTGNQWRFMPNDLPPWPAVYLQMRRWMEAGVFEILVADVQELLRHFGGRKSQPTAVCLDSRTLQSTPEIRTPAKTLGRRKELCLGGTLQKTRQRLRTTRYQSQRIHYIAFACIMITRMCKALA